MLHFVTVASQPKWGYELLLKSAERHGISVVTLGLGEPYFGNSAKIDYLINYLESLPSSDIVVFTDAYDCLYLANQEEILQKFLKFNHPLVFSTEQRFFMKLHPIFHPWIQFPYWYRYPKGKKPYRFLNSGSFMGYAGYLLNILKQLPTRENKSDQTLIGKWMLNHLGKICLDYDNQLFACSGGRVGLEFHDYKIENGRVQVKKTGCYPCIIHIPGVFHRALIQFANELSVTTPPLELPPHTISFKIRRLRDLIIAIVFQDNYLYRFVRIHLLIGIVLFIIGYLLINWL